MALIGDGPDFKHRSVAEQQFHGHLRSPGGVPLALFGAGQGETQLRTAPVIRQEQPDIAHQLIRCQVGHGQLNPLAGLQMGGVSGLVEEGGGGFLTHRLPALIPCKLRIGPVGGKARQIGLPQAAQPGRSKALGQVEGE